jgi:predicted DCC family thiol-disulfide oxidoreductase YuxK
LCADLPCAIGRRKAGDAAGLMLPVTRFVYDGFAGILFAWNKPKGRW